MGYGWCTEKGCWNYWDSTACGQSNNASSTYFINKSCSWTSTSSGWCSNVDCWAFDGTDETSCESNSFGLRCNWVDTYDTSSWNQPCGGPPEKECWINQNQSACQNVTGCSWGECEEMNCWDYTSQGESNCEVQTGMNGKACVWKTYTWSSECQEGGCWDYDNKSYCEDNNCVWDGYCYEPWCGYYSGENASYCVNNTGNQSCTWDSNSNWCNDVGCWSYTTEGACNLQNDTDCYWETYSGGWCEEQGCWTWANEATGTNCTNASLHPGFNCTWSDPWCFENITSSKSCSDLTTERDCMDSFYCWWNHSATSCNDPQTGVYETEFDEWNPGCYIFDRDQTLCGNTTGCTWSNSQCEADLTVIVSNELNCSLIRNYSVCDDISQLSTCCKWQGGNCVADRFDQSCRDEMKEPPEGAYYCEDYIAYTDNETCLEIAGDPWFMPCYWNTSLARCAFKDTDVFGGGEKNIMLISNEQNCEAAGGAWVVDTYTSTNNANTAVRLSLGRCDYKFDDERNCDKECHACEYKTDKTNWTDANEAKRKCVDSASGICTFKANAGAPNAYGFCEPKDEFKKGLVGGDCDSDCDACTYSGDAAASEGKRPSDYCSNSNAKCKWLADLDHPDDESYGRCVSKSEKTCEDKCDKCYSETNCVNKGGKEGNTSAAKVCEWNDITNICEYKSGASQMEICWDGVDNNGDNKIDCSDSMCWSDPFCGGEFMFDDFGVDCFIFDDNTSCIQGGCSWVNETWGSWCDMPGAVCWKNDGTNQTYCEADGNCTWHSGFGGFCEQDWTMGGATDTCMGSSRANCDVANNCTWVVDDWCTGSTGGGYCDPNPSFTGAWYDCVQYDDDGESTCTTSGTADSEGDFPCNWYTDSWCATQGDDAGFCDHFSFACHQFDEEDDCTEATNTTYNHSQWCTWRSDPQMDDDGWCESKLSAGGGSGGSDGCWDQSTELGCNQTAECSWVSGFCDPKGFGGNTMMGGVGGSTAVGGFGMQCMQYDGNRSGCLNQTGCGWFEEQWPHCDVNFQSNCPQYSYDATGAACGADPRCKWNPTNNYCDEKPFECMWNTSLFSNETACNASSLCYWPTDNPNDLHCHPIGFNATTESKCNTYNSTLFRWMNGWCNPAMASEFFSGMEMSGPPIPLGDDSAGDAPSNETDITSFGMKDMGFAFGFGITVKSPENSAACNDIKMSTGMGTGTATTKYYWYLDTDDDTSNGCALRHDSTSTGYEFYIKNEWAYDSTSATVTESPAVYRCSDSTWVLAEIKISSEKHLMCDQVGGAMVAIGKGELEKISDLYVPGADIRVSVATGNATHNSTSPSDTASPGWVSPGTQDFDLVDMYGYEKDATKKAKKEGADDGYVDYGDSADCWTQGGCGNYSCKGHTFCVDNSYGVEAAGFSDTRTPKVVGVVKEAYNDSAFIAYFTDKPANGTIKFYKNDSKCTSTSLNITLNDPGIDNANISTYRLEHLAKFHNGTLNYSLSNDTAYYFKIKICDDAGKCGESKCSKIVTESTTDCSFCKFVSRIKVPSGWNVHYDLDTDGSYEHHQGGILGENDGMFTNYSSGREANILLNTSDGDVHMEFLNVTLTKSGMSPKIRDVDDTSDMHNGTTTDSSGNTVGYVGMIDEVNDKIVNNLFPEKCRIKMPSDGTCDALWHCDSNNENCVDRTSSAILVNSTATSCTWQIPHCEFSNWASGEPGTGSSSSSSSSSSSGGGGGGGSCTSGYKLVDGVCTKIAEEEKTEDVKKSEGEATAGEIAAEETGAEGEVAEGESLAGEDSKGFLASLGGLAWLWITLAVVVVIVGIAIYLYRTR